MESLTSPDVTPAKARRVIRQMRELQAEILKGEGGWEGGAAEGRRGSEGEEAGEEGGGSLEWHYFEAQAVHLGEAMEVGLPATGPSAVTVETHKRVHLTVIVSATERTDICRRPRTTRANHQRRAFPAESLSEHPRLSQ